MRGGGSGGAGNPRRKCAAALDDRTNARNNLGRSEHETRNRGNSAVNAVFEHFCQALGVANRLAGRFQHAIVASDFAREIDLTANVRQGRLKEEDGADRALHGVEPVVVTL